jgi:hypothetical protein
LLNSYHLELKVYDLVDSVLEEVKETESEAKERIVTVFKLTEMLGPIEVGVKVYEEIDSKEQRTSTTIQGTMRILAAVKIFLRKRKVL